MAIKFTTTELTKEAFFGSLFQIRDKMHLNHLKTKSYSEHKTLNKFYDGILDLTDSLIESYQGKYGIINISIPAAITSDSIADIAKLASLTDGGSVYNLFKDTFIQNQLDEISTLCYTTLYKLKNLK